MDIPPALIDTLHTKKRPLLIGVSGFGGSGKTTFSRLLAESLDAACVSTDDFIMHRAQGEVRLWDFYDTVRLTREIIQPFMSGETELAYGTYNWNLDRIEPTGMCSAREGVLIVEGIGLYTPPLRTLFGYTIWVACPLPKAVRRGKERDRAHGADHGVLWDGLWQENDRAFFETYTPDRFVDIVISNA